MMPATFLRQFVIPLLLAALCALLAGCFVLKHMWDQEMHRGADLSEAVYFVVEKGSSLREVADSLHHSRLIRRPWFFVYAAWWENKAGVIQSGEYQFAPGITPPDILQQLVAGSVYQYSITLVEGWTVTQALRSLRAQTAIRPRADENGLPLSGEQIMGLLKEADIPPEGAFYPDTYHFPRGADELVILRQARAKLRQVLNEEWQSRADNLPYKHPYEALIMASLIEKEAQLDRERGHIAGVFVRRLQRNMRLQSDPTVIYAYGEDFTGPLLRHHMNLASPYNTYARHGLPPTPICLTARRSIRAALQPEPGKALYFVALGDGSHHFSESLREHNNMRQQIKRSKR